MLLLIISTFLCCKLQHEDEIEFGSIFTSLSGRVVDSIGGSAVVGAKVSLKGTSYISNTNSDGSFIFENILIGVYDIVVETENMAGSKLEQVHITNKNANHVEIVQTKYSYNPSEISTPSIKISGISRTKVYKGILPIEVEVKPGSCPVIGTDFHKSVYLKIGSTQTKYRELATSNNSTISYNWNTTLLPPGKVYLKIVAYDNNNNRSELNIPVYVDNGTGNPPDIIPLDDHYFITATTYGKSLAITKSISDSFIIKEQSDNYRSIVPDTTITVDFSVIRFFSGVIIYKSNTENGDFLLFGQTSNCDCGSYKFTDYSSSLEPDTTIYYKIAYFNQYGTGPSTEPVSVRILPKYSLKLVSPANNSIINDLTPTIEWECDLIFNAQRTDWIIVKNILDGTFVKYGFEINTNEFTLPSLNYNNKYEWDIRSVYEYDNNPEKLNVKSYSFPGGEGSSDFSENGSFYFTVAVEEEQE